MELTQLHWGRAGLGFPNAGSELHIQETPQGCCCCPGETGETLGGQAGASEAFSRLGDSSGPSEELRGPGQSAGVGD